MRPHRKKPSIVFHRGNEVAFRGRLNPSALRYFQPFVNHLRINRPDTLLLDFGYCTHAYPNCMVPLIANTQELLELGIDIRCKLPINDNLRRLFRKSNWAHFLAPNQYEISDEIHDRHSALRQFKGPNDQHRAVNDIIDVVMRSHELDRSVISALEWTINEITDNVINHADSSVGGFVQLTTYTDNQKIAICVADPGRGILESLRESNPGLRLDTHAIADAVRAGVTRNKDVGQGNGLSGTLSIAMQTNGRFVLSSGSGWVTWENNQPTVSDCEPRRRYDGTIVDLQLPIAQKIDLEKALSLGSDKYRSYVDNIEVNYLSDDCSKIILNMRGETTTFGSRYAGRQMRVKAINLMAAEPTCPLVIDWDGIQMISSSYADEFIGKLFHELGPMQFMSKVRNNNMLPMIAQLIDKAIIQRAQQEQVEFSKESETGPRPVQESDDDLPNQK